jgi:phage gpG-like protein
MQIIVRGLEAVRAKLATLESGLVRGALNVLGQTAKDLVQDGFRNERAPDGTGWQPLSQATIAKKNSSRILVDNGLMRNSWNYRVTETVVTIGTNDPKAPFHQYGTRRIPIREMLPSGQLPTFWQQEFDQALDAYIALRVRP